LFPMWLSRIAIAIAATTLASCNSMVALFEEDYPIDKVDDAYTARDSCLKWTVVMSDDGTTDPAEMGARVARSCGAEITALVLTTDPNGDPVVARKINADSMFRATGYVIKSRYAASAIAQKR
jgi:hypothetical protein